MVTRDRSSKSHFFKSIFQYKYFPIFLLLLCFITYSILLPWLHVFADDLSFLFYYRTLGRSGFVQALAFERPGQGLLYTLTFPILGTSALAWQIFALITRWLAAVFLWLLLNVLWPGTKRQNMWITVLFAVFPGFHQHWVVVTYSHLYLALALTFLSLWSMLKSFSAGKKFPIYLIISLIASACNLFMFEYFFGLELSRPVIIWLYWIKEQPEKKRRFIETAKKYWPYALLLFIYLIWRFFIFESDKYNPRLVVIYGSNFFAILTGLIKDIFLGFYVVVIQVWVDLFRVFSGNYSGVSNLFTIGILFVGSVLTSVYFIFSDRFKLADQKEKKSEIINWCLQAIPFALISIFFCLIPFKIGGFPISLQNPWDRFLLAFMFSSSLLLVALGELLGTLFRPLKFILIILIITLSIGSQYTAANSYRKALLLERNFFWQLSWRIPNLRPGTILMTDSMNLPYYSENTLSSQLNYIFDPDLRSTQMKYVFAYIDGRIRDIMLDYTPALDIELCDRNICFTGSTSDIVVFKYFPSSCLRILDPIYTNAIVMTPELSPSLQSAVPYSMLDRIVIGSEDIAIPPVSDFGPEPPHEWCYYFEKADLARQAGDWDQIVSLWHEAEQGGFEPTQPTELYPFIEGLAFDNEWQEASELTILAKRSEIQIPGLCELWLRIDTNTPEKTAYSAQIVQSVLYNLGCNSQ